MEQIENRTFNEIKLGDTANLIRTLTFKDIEVFAIVSGDINPTHVDAAFTKSDAFHKVVAHAMWGSALIRIVEGGTKSVSQRITRHQAWIDELIGHESTIRRSEGERYTKEILLPIPQRLVNSIQTNADLAHLRYAGEVGIPAPNRDWELARFAALAEREMKKKVKLQ